MLVEEEVVDFIARPTGKRNAAHVDRDSLLVTYYYGFGDAPWPTYDYLADRFGIGSRERVRQIINERFRDYASIEALPTCQAIADFLDETTQLVEKEILAHLRQLRLIDGHIRLRGVLNLMQDLGRCQQIDLYGTDLQRLTRAEVRAPQHQILMLRNSRVESLRAALRIARTLPGRLGMARMDALSSELFAAGLQEDFDVIRSIVLVSDDAVIVTVSGVEWFSIRDRENVLSNGISRLRSQTDECNINVCSEVLANALRARSNKHQYPGPKEIDAYLRANEDVIVVDATVRFIGAASAPTPVEQAASDYLRHHGSAHFPELKLHLESLGYGLPLIQKAVSTSPVVWVDKSAGRGAYVYRAIPSTVAVRPTPQTDQRYNEFRARLQRILIGGTDASTEATARREQGALREWLFGTASLSLCAICGQRFLVDSLVAAHKKPRHMCTDEERTDPNIVMPLCRFGCDHSYELGLLSIAPDGTLVEGPCTAGPAEASFILPLLGRRIPDVWRRGNPRYFLETISRLPTS